MFTNLEIGVFSVITSCLFALTAALLRVIFTPEAELHRLRRVAEAAQNLENVIRGWPEPHLRNQEERWTVFHARAHLRKALREWDGAEEEEEP